MRVLEAHAKLPGVVRKSVRARRFEEALLQMIEVVKSRQSRVWIHLLASRARPKCPLHSGENGVKMGTKMNAQDLNEKKGFFQKSIFSLPEDVSSPI